MLPVELTTFISKSQKQGVELIWETASEKNNDYFLVEKSTDAKQFESLGKVQGAGTTLVPKKYRFLDATSTEKGTLYYRLKQVDFNESFEYSSIVSATLKGTSKFKSYPNPVNDVLYLETQEDAPFYVTISNELGQII